MRALAAAGLLCGLAGCDGVKFGVGNASAPPGSDERAALDTLAQRSLPLPDCRGADDLAELGQVFVFSLDTASLVDGNLSGPQPEHVVRQGVAALCMDGQGAVAQFLTCALVRTPVEDPSGDCAALLPSVAVLAGLPPAFLTGGLDPAEPESTLVLQGFDERWGLSSEQVELPAVAPEDPTTLAGLVDADDDGDPGVTLSGDGEVPTQIWAVRRTQANLVLRDAGGGVLRGISIAATQELVLGGPAARAVGSRTYTDARADVTLVRTDGLGGSPRADANRDGVITCAEGSKYFGRLPALPTSRCP